MTCTGFSRASKAAQLVAFLSGDPIARKRFPEMYHKSILKQAKRLMSLYGNDLDASLAEDVVQCFWLSLLKSMPDIFHTGGNADGFIENRLLTAIRDVRAMFTPPGQRTRLPKKGSDKAKNRRLAAVSFDAPLSGAENDQTLADIYEDPSDEIAKAINRISIDQQLELLQTAIPVPASQALRLMVEAEISFSKAAQSVRLHPTSLRRSLKALSLTHSDYFP